MREVLAVTQPYDAPWVLEFLRARALPGVERVEGSSWQRATLVNGQPALLRVEVRPDALEVETPVPLDQPTRARLERLFDARTDLAEVRRTLESDSRLRRAITRRPGLRVPGAWEPFETAVRAVIGQQISVAAAVTVARRLVEAFGTPFAGLPGGPWRSFPTPETLASAPLEDVPGLRLRAPVVSGLARAVCEGALRLDGSWALPRVETALRAIRGIGPWTASIVALRALGDSDALPTADLGLRRALGRGRRLASAREVERRAERWRPWRGYATLWLWSEGTT
ncbi:MAG TPA: AlkA N-terminal domain-containing protein [Myxococcaceae bacterium]|nr:AlkA N-terminal domain-containing protein [Myxococcaceae bacterium]